MKRGAPLRRTRMKRRGKRAAREAEALAAFRAAIYLRCGVKEGDPFREGICQRCRQVRAINAHHGRTNPRVHKPELGFGLCWRCHAAIHDHTAGDWEDWFA